METEAIYEKSKETKRLLISSVKRMVNPETKKKYIRVYIRRWGQKHDHEIHIYSTNPIDLTEEEYELLNLTIRRFTKWLTPPSSKRLNYTTIN